MKKLIKKSLEQAISYESYSQLLKELVDEEQTSGPEQTADKINFTKLNYSRSKRLDKTIALDEETLHAFKKIKFPLTWLVITESWCGDAAQTLPILNKLAQASEKIKLQLVLRDENPELMDAFLTNGTRSIPKLVIIDENQDVITTWGPRSDNATKMVQEYKAIHGKIDANFKKELQVWYNKDKGQSIIEEIRTIIQKLAEQEINFSVV